MSWTIPKMVDYGLKINKNVCILVWNEVSEGNAAHLFVNQSGVNIQGCCRVWGQSGVAKLKVRRWRWSVGGGHLRTGLTPRRMVRRCRRQLRGTLLVQNQPLHLLYIRFGRVHIQRLNQTLIQKLSSKYSHIAINNSLKVQIRYLKLRPFTCLGKKVIQQSIFGKWSGETNDEQNEQKLNHDQLFEQ